jgi:hypothetical protein
MGMYFVASNAARIFDGKPFAAEAFNPFAALR